MQLARAVDGLDHHGGGAVGEEDGGAAVVPVGDAREGLGSDQQHLAGAGGDDAVGQREAVDEPRARRIDVDGPAPEAEVLLHRGGGAGHCLVRGGGGEDDEVDLGRLDTRSGQRHPTGLGRQLRGGAPDPALPDAGPLGDPLVAGVHGGGEVVVGDDLVGQRCAPPGDRHATLSLGHAGHVRPSSARRWAADWSPVRRRRRCRPAARPRTVIAPRGCRRGRARARWRSGSRRPGPRPGGTPPPPG